MNAIYTYVRGKTMTAGSEGKWSGIGAIKLLDAHKSIARALARLNFPCLFRRLPSA